jgi:hypothetical protein
MQIRLEIFVPLTLMFLHTGAESTSTDSAVGAPPAAASAANEAMVAEAC